MGPRPGAVALVCIAAAQFGCGDSGEDAARDATAGSEAQAADADRAGDREAGHAEPRSTEPQGAAAADDDESVEELFRSLLEQPQVGWSTQRPGWTRILYPKRLRPHGVRLVDKLIGYLRDEHERDGVQLEDGLSRRDHLVMLTAQLAADAQTTGAIRSWWMSSRRSPPAKTRSSGHVSSRSSRR
jgi:hypothetical protein